MGSRVRLLLENIRASYWFIPSVAAFLDGSLLFVLLAVDASQPEWMTSWAIQFQNAEGARQLLATVVGAVISVIGTVFSLTILVLTMAGAHYGMRLLRNFMKDIQTQAVLAIFLTTLIHCLVTLISVGNSASVSALPVLTLLFAVLLMFASIGALIFFIHHISVRIQAPTVIAALSDELMQTLDRLFPANENGKHHAFKKRYEEPSINWDRDGIALKSQSYGYIDEIDFGSLCRFAEEKDGMIKVVCQAGDFLLEGQKLGYFYPRDHYTPDYNASFFRAFLLKKYRTTSGDIGFAVEQLVEVAEKALSPGINEPLVAVMCIDYLTCAYTVILTRPKPPSAYEGKDGRTRLIKRPVHFEELFNMSFGVIANYANASPKVILLLAEKASILHENAKSPEDKKTIEGFVERVSALMREKIWTTQEKPRLEALVRQVLNPEEAVK